MKDYEFEKTEITFGEEVSYLDSSGATHYGRIVNYNPLIPSFEFKENEKSSPETIYLKDVERFFRKE